MQRATFVLATLLASTTASADETPAYKSTPRVHAHLGLSHAVGTPQGGDFGFGGAAAVAGELPIFSCFSAEVAAGGIFLLPNDAPPGLPARSTATIGFFTGGVRFHPRPRMGPAGPWFGGGAGLAINGKEPRFGANGMLGWDFALRQGSIAIGPMAAYTHVLEPGTERQDQADAHIVWGGLHVSFGGRRVDETPAVATGPDADGDGVADSEDACPQAKGVRTQDLNTSGCPEGDRDGDGIPNADDACPESKGEANAADPKLHGCPPPIKKEDDDRDGDTVPSSVDACPDEPGQPNADPKLNGCPIPQKPASDVELE